MITFLGVFWMFIFYIYAESSFSVRVTSNVITGMSATEPFPNINDQFWSVPACVWVYTF